MRKTTLNSSKRKGMNRAQRRSSKTLAERKRAHVQQLIKEEMLMIEQHIRTGEIVAREEQRMLREGYSRDEINEGIMDFLGKIPGNYMDYLKQYFAEMLLRKLGFDTESLLGYALKNILEEMEWMSITKYFGKGGCRPLTDLIIRGLIEAIGEKGLDKIAELLFGKKMEGFISGTGREMLMDTLKNMQLPIYDHL